MLAVGSLAMKMVLMVGTPELAGAILPYKLPYALCVIPLVPWADQDP